MLGKYKGNRQQKAVSHVDSISYCHYWRADEPRSVLHTGLCCLLRANSNISWLYCCTLMFLTIAEVEALILSSSHHLGCDEPPTTLTLTLLTSFLIQQIALVPVPEPPTLQQSWTDLQTSKSICENWQLEENYELQHQGARIQNCTLANFWKDLLSICILFTLGKISLQTNIKRFFFWVRWRVGFFVPSF